VAEIRIFPYNFAPTGWAFCDGQLLPISQNTALFSLLGTMYGGDGRTTFALPDLQGSVPIGSGQGPGLSARTVGMTGGVDYVSLLESEIPSHTHSFMASARPAAARHPSGAYLAAGQGVGMYDANTQPTTTMAPAMTAAAGGSLPHNNAMPYLTTQICIALQGVFPPRS
jgi:microcystin-dependent protein